MRLKTKYILWGACFYTAILGSMFYLAQKDVYVFFGLEALLIVSLIIYISLYRQFVRPIELLNRGTKLLLDKDFTTRLSPVGQKELDNLIDVYNKMTAQLQNERTRQLENYHLLQSLSEVSPMGIILLDFDGAIEQINPSAVKILGGATSEAFLQKKLEDVGNKLTDASLSLKVNTSETVSISGKERFFIYKGEFLDRGFYRHYILLQEMSNELLHAEKEAYARVIRTMSHEVNNSVGAINSILESVSGDLQDDSHKAVVVAIERNSNMANFMKNFADIVKLATPSKQEIDLNTFFRHIVLLMQKSCEESGVELSFSEATVPFSISADRFQLEQAVINIVKNAVEAIEGKGEIKITLDSDAKEISIANNGKPISETEAAQLFTPFFTTKENGQGIGLTLVRDILMNHGFDFSLRTLGGGWTVFSVGGL